MAYPTGRSIKIIPKLPSIKYDLRGRINVQFSTRKLDNSKHMKEELFWDPKWSLFVACDISRFVNVKLYVLKVYFFLQ